MKDEKIIELVGVSKTYDGFTAVDDVTFYVKKGEFVTFLGPSGCGKTTTLRMIAGFEMPTSGKILLNGNRDNNNQKMVNVFVANIWLTTYLYEWYNGTNECMG